MQLEFYLYLNETCICIECALLKCKYGTPFVIYIYQPVYKCAYILMTGSASGIGVMLIEMKKFLTEKF